MSEDKPINIAIIGLGGQGVITLAKLTALSFDKLGKDVCYNEIHGLSQRGGSVQSLIRVNEKENPIFLSKDVDYVVGLEKLETLRYLYNAREAKPVVVFTNIYNVRSTMDLGLEKFPPSDEIDKEIIKYASKAYLFDALSFQESIKGAFKPINVAIFSILAEIDELGLPKETAKKVVEEKLGKNLILKRINMKAFNGGAKWLKIVKQ